MVACLDAKRVVRKAVRMVVTLVLAKDVMSVVHSAVKKVDL